ncbi:hypothetical protein HPP92_006759 [Vanilla planifolia]|uniref:Uncharacterized protein n=1 Tax=Vanilla planifolia TaxID=51239 RepID=A0A835RCL9_VANPL|nr:hypothetical protein HPP92_006759 [Vanilla planifolia]
MRDFEPAGEVNGLCGMTMEDEAVAAAAATVAAAFSLLAPAMVGWTELWTFLRRKTQVKMQYKMVQMPTRKPTEPTMAKMSHPLLVFLDAVGGDWVTGGDDVGDWRGGEMQDAQMTPELEQRDSESGKMPHLQELWSGTQIPGRILGRAMVLTIGVLLFAFQQRTVKLEMVIPQVRSPPATMDSNMMPSAGEYP